MCAISQTTFSNAFSWKKIYEFRLKFHWRLFLRIQLTTFQHWFRQWLGAYRWPVDSPHKEPVTRKMFPFDDVIMHGYHVSIYRQPINHISPDLNLTTLAAFSCFLKSAAKKSVKKNSKMCQIQTGTKTLIDKSHSKHPYLDILCIPWVQSTHDPGIRYWYRKTLICCCSHQRIKIKNCCSNCLNPCQAVCLSNSRVLLSSWAITKPQTLWCRSRLQAFIFDNFNRSYSM